MCDDYTSHSSSITMFGECEAYFFMVCPALEDGDEICEDCPIKEEILKEMKGQKTLDEF